MREQEPGFGKEEKGMKGDAGAYEKFLGKAVEGKDHIGPKMRVTFGEVEESRGGDSGIDDILNANVVNKSEVARSPGTYKIAQSSRKVRGQLKKGACIDLISKRRLKDTCRKRTNERMVGSKVHDVGETGEGESDRITTCARWHKSEKDPNVGPGMVTLEQQPHDFHRL